jgi:Ca2+-binding RTX toxin-like protein
MAKRSGTEFLVNTTTSNEQSLSAVTGLANGRFVVTWQDLSQTGGDTSGYATRAQIFNADGTTFGGEFLVNTATASFQLDPDITSLDDGRFVVVWTDFSQSAGDTSSNAVRGQIFNPDGSKSGGEFVVPTTVTGPQNEASIATLSDGRFVVSWTDQSHLGGDPSESAIKAQVFNATGTKSGTEFLVNSSTAFIQDQPAITGLKNGGFVISWTDHQDALDDASFSAIRMQVYNAAGAVVGGEVLVNTTTTNEQLESDVTALAGGRFVVTWRDRSQSGDDTFNDAVRAQVFTASGARVGTEFVVNTTTALDQDQPAITALPDGRFVIAWRDESASAGDMSGTAIRAQVYNANGTPKGAEFLVPTTTLGAQSEPDVTALADGRFTVTWTDLSATSPDTSNFALRGQIFDARTAAVAVDGTAGADDYLGTKFADTLKGFGGGDSLAGGNGNDTLLGGAGADTLVGGGGADLLQGGTGPDVVTGGGGADVFQFASAAQANQDLITDHFHLTDRIDLSAFMAGGSFIGSGPFTGANQVRYATATGLLRGDVDGDGTADWALTLISLPSLTAGDFIF